LIYAQTPRELGVNGGRGPKGGQGDIDKPVPVAQAWITDALIPSGPNRTRQLARGIPPARLIVYPSTANRSCKTPLYNVTLDADNGARQELLGFGHSWTDSTVEVFKSLQPAVFDQAMRDLFGQEGNNMGMMRHTIGSSDMSYDQYSYDDNGPSFNYGNSPNLTLSTFDLTDNGRHMADMIASMGDYKADVTLFGSPWPAPAWMKRNGLFIAPEINVDGGAAYYFTNNTFDFNYGS
jgi:glucosylceramidase